MLHFHPFQTSNLSCPESTAHEKFDVRNASINISNTRKSVSSGYPHPEKWVEKTRRSQVFLTDFEVFGYLMKHSFEFLIWLLKPFIILGEIQSKKLIKFHANQDPVSKPPSL